MRTPEEIAARERGIIGKLPRIPPRRTKDYLLPAREILAKISGVASGKAEPLPDEHIPEMLLTVMCYRELFEQLANVSLQLLKNPALPLRDRQLLILCVSWLRQIPYIWGEHVAVSEKLGLKSEDIEEVILARPLPTGRNTSRPC